MSKAQTLDYKKMLEDIDDLVNNDFGEDMSMKANITVDGVHKVITQEEARKMANIIGQVYLISHAISCTNCGGKYVK